MTTPAVNIQRQLNRTGYTYTIYNSGETYISSGPTLARKFWRWRPESSTSPLIGDFRYPTAWTHDRFLLVVPDMTFRENYTWGYRYYTGSSFLALGTPTGAPFLTELENKAVNGALERLKDQKVNLSQAFAERKKTQALFSDVGEEVSGRINSFRRKNGSLWDKVKTLNPRLESYPRKWLALQYGVKPLLSDVFGACEALSELEQKPKPYRVTVSYTAKDQDERVRRDLVYQHGDTRYPLLVSERDEHLYRCSLTYEMSNPPLASLSSLGITNPAALAYELLPYSFALDWLVPVGGYLSLLDSDFGWSYVAGSLGRLSKRRGRGMYFVPYPIGVTGGFPARYRYEIDSFSRFTYPSSPWPRFPGLKNPVSAGHVANALSLVASAFR